MRYLPRSKDASVLQLRPRPHSIPRRAAWRRWCPVAATGREEGRARGPAKPPPRSSAYQSDQTRRASSGNAPVPTDLFRTGDPSCRKCSWSGGTCNWGGIAVRTVFNGLVYVGSTTYKLIVLLMVIAWFSVAFCATWLCCAPACWSDWERGHPEPCLFTTAAIIFLNFPDRNCGSTTSVNGFLTW